MKYAAGFGPRSWERGRPVPESRHGEVVPLGMSSSGTTAYVSAWTRGFSGVAALNLASGSLRKIHPFADPATDQADGSSGGRWVAWAETHSLSTLDDFTIYAWDSVTGRLLTLGHSINRPGGTPWPSPWHPPAVSGSYAAWAQGYGPGGEVEVRLAGLAAGRVRACGGGPTGRSFLAQNLVVGAGPDRRGAQPPLPALSPAPGRPAALPPVLAAGRPVARLSACSVVCAPGRSDSGHTTRFRSKNGGWAWPVRMIRTWPVTRSASRTSTSPPGPYPWAQAA